MTHADRETFDTLSIERPLHNLLYFLPPSPQKMFHTMIFLKWHILETESYDIV
jgi:hypothetical protein